MKSSKSKIGSRNSKFSNLEQIDENRLLQDEGNFNEGSMDKDYRNPACEEGIMLEEKGG